MPIFYGKQPVKAHVSYPIRSFGAIYKNETGRPLLVIITIDCWQKLVDERAQILCYINDFSPPTTTVEQCGLREHGGPNRAYFVAIFVVPNNYWYKVVESAIGTAEVNLFEWLEVEL